MLERTEIDDLESIKHPCPKYIVHLYTHIGTISITNLKLLKQKK